MERTSRSERVRCNAGYCQEHNRLSIRWRRFLETRSELVLVPLGVVVFLGLWEALVAAAQYPEFILPAPSRILERWTTEGKGVGESGRHSKKDTSPDKYFKGKYGHLVQR